MNILKTIITMKNPTLNKWINIITYDTSHLIFIEKSIIMIERLLVLRIFMICHESVNTCLSVHHFGTVSCLGTKTDDMWRITSQT